MGYNFFVNDLGFNKNPTDAHPYQRATATFQKDQLDTSTSPGDQSLTGWWTRGQLSFHRGAGITFYEVSRSTDIFNTYRDVLDRYLSSVNLNPFTSGKVSLLPAVSDLAVSGVIDATPGSVNGAGGVILLTSGGLKFAAGSTVSSVSTSDGGVPTWLTSDGRLAYVTNGTRIEVQADAANNRYNYVLCPSFKDPAQAPLWTTDVGTLKQGWEYAAGSGNQGASGTTGSGYLRFDENAGSAGGPLLCKVDNLTVGTQYRVEAVVAVAASGMPAGGTRRLQMAVAAGTSSAWGADQFVDAPYSSTQSTVSLTVTASATTQYVHFRVNPADLGKYMEFEVYSLIVTPESGYDGFFDGSSAGASWEGTAFNSRSVRASAGAGDATASLVTLSTAGRTFTRAWWAKGRLFAVDDAGNWYAIPAADLGTTVATTDAFWSSGRAGLSWTLSDSPGPVYLSNGSDVFAVTVDNAGAVPALQTPTTVIQAPAGETIGGMAFYLSYLVLATSRGVRLAMTQNNTQVVMGGLVVEGDFSACRRIGLYDTRAYVVGRPATTGANDVMVLELAESITDLICAYATGWSFTNAASVSNGAVVDPSGSVLSWTSGSAHVSGTMPSASGTLTTGYHRFETLDTKLFSSVLVRTSGTGGTVAVSRVDADGTITPLGSVAAGQDEVLQLGMPAPAERVALQFTLTADGANAPVLLGYQLKALPSPVRQEMIQVPCLLYSVEKTASGRATGGSPWTRYAALKDLENNNALVTFRDTDTGETGTALIETVELMDNTPPNPADRAHGFGGLVTITLRKL